VNFVVKLPPARKEAVILIFKLKFIEATNLRAVSKIYLFFRI